MGKMQSTITSEIIRLSSREMRKVWVPLRKDVRLLKGMVSQLRKSVSELQRFIAQQEKLKPKQEKPLIASPEEVGKSRFSPRLLQILRKNLGITQKELAVLAGVSIGAVVLWEKGKFRPKEDKMAVFVGLRKLGPGGVRKLLEGIKAG
jgi:DNA-binding transcriptional regulator YiaG